MRPIRKSMSLSVKVSPEIWGAFTSTAAQEERKKQEILFALVTEWIERK
jgi:hypothetical protein